jgi:hypothetical protein
VRVQVQVQVQVVAGSERRIERECEEEIVVGGRNEVNRRGDVCGWDVQRS